MIQLHELIIVYVSGCDIHLNAQKNISFFGIGDCKIHSSSWHLIETSKKPFLTCLQAEDNSLSSRTIFTLHVPFHLLTQPTTGAYWTCVEIPVLVMVDHPSSHSLTIYIFTLLIGSIYSNTAVTLIEQSHKNLRLWDTYITDVEAQA